MSLPRRIARPMLAAIFISGGIDSLRNPHGRAKVAGPVALKTAELLPVQLPRDPVRLVQIDAAVKLGAGLMLATHRFPRIASLALAGSLVPTTIAAHRFWEFDDPQQRAQQRTHFLKNVGLLGGLILAAVDTGGRPSVGWMARRAARKTKRRARAAAKSARKSLPVD